MREKRYGLLAVTIIAILGLALIIFGFILGGRPGSFNDVEGSLIYETSSDSIYVCETPRWLSVFGTIVYTAESSDYDDSSYDVGAGEYDDSSSDVVEDSAAEESSSFESGILYSGESMDISGYKLYDISVDYGSVTIKGGDTATITVQGDMTADVTVNDNTLYIISESDYDDWRNWTNHYDDNNKIIITLPSSLEYLSAYLGAGKMSISDLSTDIFDLNVSAGAATVSNVNASDSSASVEAGSMSLKELNTQSANLSCQAGSISVNGNIEKQLIADCSTGSISVSMPDPQDYSYDLDCSLGNLSLGSLRLNNGSQSKEGSSDAMYFQLACSIGNLAVTFR